jgi:indole-3-glycerol phosphate synthase
MGFLSEVVERVRKELERDPPPERTLLMRTRSAPPPRDFAAALARPGTSIIAEIKRASPSAGRIADTDPGERAAVYERAGAAAVSVLTEPRYFEGSLLDLRAARRRSALPLLRKDFIVHPVQVIEARAESADAVLLIAAALSGGELRNLLDVATDLGMAAVVETHSLDDLEKALAGDAQIVGVNARDLETLEVHPEAALELARRVPSDRLLVVESGISARKQVMEAEEAGADAVLVGEALMRSADPGRTIRRLLGALSVVDGAEGDGP